MAIYLYPKNFLESKDDNSNNDDGAMSYGHDINEWIDIVSKDIDFYYGQYITRLLIDLICIIVPYDRFLSKSSLLSNMFEIKDTSLFQKSIDAFIHGEDDIDNDSSENIDFALLDQISELDDEFYPFKSSQNVASYTDDDSYEKRISSICEAIDMFPTLWSLISLNKSNNNKNECYCQEIFGNKDFEKFASSFLSQMNSNNDEKTLITNVVKVFYLLSEGYNAENFYSESMLKLKKQDFYGRYPHFCDLMLFHQIKEVLFRQQAVPYHVNIGETKRWQYTAKETPMYMDLLILDECRYLYDWMPTIDMINNSLDDIERQLSFRFALDGVSQHRYLYNSEFFFGTTCVGLNHEGFHEKELSKRTVIT